VDEWRRRVPQTRFTLHVLGNFEDLEEAVSLTVYRLIQEGLTNAYKHAGATHVEIVLERRPPPIAEADGDGDGDVRLTVFDNGRGADPAARRTGHGLNGLRERVELAGGTFLIDSAPGQGFRLTARLRVGKS
jgi:signal transduction histidine kinase